MTYYDGERIYKRVAEEVMFGTLRYLLSTELGVELSSEGQITGFINSGNIFGETLPQIYNNTRTKSANNLESSRFPIISIVTDNIDMELNLSRGSESTVDATATGLIKYYTPEALIIHDTNIVHYTNTLKDQRLLHNQMMSFLEKYRNGGLMVNDIIDEATFSLIYTNQHKRISDEVPYISIYPVQFRYLLYSEQMRYAMQSFKVNFSIKQDELETNSSTGEATNTLSYTSSGSTLT